MRAGDVRDVYSTRGAVARAQTRTMDARE